MTQQGQEDLAALLRELTDAVTDLREEVGTLSARFRRSRKSTGVLAAVVVGMMILGGLYYHDVLGRRAAAREQTQETHDQTRQLACLIVSYFPSGRADVVDTIREKYQCPPFDPSTLPTPRITPTPAPTVTSTAPGKPGPTRTTTAQPSPAATVTVSGAAHVVRVPGPTRTVTFIPDRPPVTRTVTATVTVTPPCLLHLAVCVLSP